MAESIERASVAIQRTYALAEKLTSERTWEIAALASAATPEPPVQARRLGLREQPSDRSDCLPERIRRRLQTITDVG